MPSCGYIFPAYTMGSPFYYIHPSCYPVWDGNYSWNLTTTPGVNWALNGYNVIESIINANALGTGILVDGSTGQISETPVITGGNIPTLPNPPLIPPFINIPGIPGPVYPQVTPQTFGSPGFTNGPLANTGSLGAAAPMLGQTEQFLASLPPELTGGGGGGTMSGSMGGAMPNAGSSMNQALSSTLSGTDAQTSAMLQKGGLSLNGGGGGVAQPATGMASASPMAAAQQPARANAGGMPQMDPGMAMMMFMAFLQAMVQFMPFLQQMMQQQQGQAVQQR